MPRLATSSRTDHLAEDCRDPDCPRFPCQLWKQAVEATWERAYGTGFRDGEASGFAAGFSAGAAAAAGNG